MYRDNEVYEGGEPYLFISYPHNDSAVVLPIIRSLSERGYRVWYDQGITPGSVWSDNIAEHIRKSGVVLAFISPAYTASPVCLQEFTYALLKEKTLLGVMLEPTEIPSGMEMQLSTHQYIKLYHYIRPDTGHIDEEAFFGKLSTAEQFRACRREAPDRNEELFKQELSAAEKDSSGAVVRVSEAELPAAPEGPVQSKQRNTEKPARKGKPKAKSSENSEQKELRKDCFIIGLIALVLMAVGITMYLKRQVTITPNIKASASASYITITDEQVDHTVIRQLNKLRKLRSISFVNCDFRESIFKEYRLSSLRTLSELNSLKFESCSGLKSYDFLRSADSLTELTICSCDLQKDDLNVNGTNIRTLDVSGNPRLSRLDELPLYLTSLNCSDTGLTDLSFLIDLPQLTKLTMDGCTAVKDFEPLTQCKSLTFLSAKNCGITGFSGVFASLSMHQLYLDGNSISDGACFGNMTRLEDLSMKGNPVSELSCIGKSAGTLKRLDLSGTAVDEAFLRENVGQCTKMEKLFLHGVRTEDLDFMQDMSEIREIHASGCEIADISALAKKEKLKVIILADNRISDTSPLSDRGVFSSSQMIEWIIDLHHNEITAYDLPPFIDVLLLYGNDPALPAMIPWPAKIRYMVVDYDPCLLSEEMDGIRSGWEIAPSFCVLDAPNDQVLNLQDRLGIFSTVLTTTEKFEQVYDEAKLSEIWAWDFS